MTTLQSKNAPLYFSLIGPRRTLDFQAPTEDIRSKWADALRNALLRVHSRTGASAFQQASQAAASSASTPTNNNNNDGSGGRGVVVPTQATISSASYMSTSGRPPRFGMIIENAPNGGRGALVVEVEHGSFADDMGILNGDVIMSINGRPVSDMEDVPHIQKTLTIGDQSTFEISRLRGTSRAKTIFLTGRLVG